MGKLVYSLKLTVLMIGELGSAKVTVISASRIRLLTDHDDHPVWNRQFDKMLLEFILFIGFVAFLKHSFSKGLTKLKVEKSNPSAKLSFLESIPLLLAITFNNSIPNYELSQKWHQTFGSLFYMILPFRKNGLGSLADLATAKTIMSSAAWPVRMCTDHYVHTFSYGKPLGLLFGTGGYWKESRKLTLKLLHQLDFNRQENVEKFINFEVADVEQEIYDAVKDGNGEATVTMHQKFEVSALNVVYQVMLGKRFNRNDPVAKKMMHLINEANRQFNVGTSILEIFPWLTKVPFLHIMDRILTVGDFMWNYLKTELIEPKRRAKTYKTDPIDFVDHFLLEIDRRAGDSPRYLTDENLIATLRDLIFAGADTTSTALEYGILHVSLNLLIQQKVQAEIDRVIGTRQPRYDDRFSMPYTQAVLQEILRVSSPIPATARSPITDTKINDNIIPKDSFIAINLYAIHHSADLWDSPEIFQPERFLNHEGELVNLDKILPFGYGKRPCVGETVARISLFLFFVTLMQKFTFEISNEHPPPSMKNQLGLSRAPSAYYVKIKCRSSAQNH